MSFLFFLLATNIDKMACLYLRSSAVLLLAFKYAAFFYQPLLLMFSCPPFLRLHAHVSTTAHFLTRARKRDTAVPV